MGATVASMGNLDAALGAVVRSAIRDSGLNLRSVSTLTGIPYTTLRRKADGLSSFAIGELLAIGNTVKQLPSELVASAEASTVESVA